MNSKSLIDNLVVRYCVGKNLCWRLGAVKVLCQSIVKGRVLLDTISGRGLGPSFHAVPNVGIKMIKQALESGDVNHPQSQSELTWNRMELLVMLEHVQNM
ncbi:hypothetical protein Hdeb2414_s0025g00656691 [Helianthus debilis subsp. tardiflorus]